MTNRGIDLQQTGISSRKFTIPTISLFNNYQASFRFESHADGNVEALRKILKRLSRTYLPGKEHIEAYLRHVTRRNRSAKTLYNIWTAILLFLGMVKNDGKSSLSDVTRGDVEAFVEREQDRGLKVTTIRVRLVCVYAFFRYLVEEGISAPEVIGRKIRLQLPERLPLQSSPKRVSPSWSSSPASLARMSCKPKSKLISCSFLASRDLAW